MKTNRITAIVNARIFNGERVIERCNVLIKGEKIINVGGGVPEGAEVIDAKGCTLLPGLIDAHSHPNMEALKLDMAFGVTTTYQMQGYWSPEQRKEIAERRDIADCLTSLMSICAPDGHPNELLPPQVLARQKDMAAKMGVTIRKDASTPEEAAERVRERVADGVDYIKVMVEDGTVFGHPGTPNLTDEVLKTICDEAHKHGIMAVAHAMDTNATERVIKAGIDGLMHVFIDKPHTKEIINLIAESGAFVCPTIVAGASTVGDSDAAEFGKDKRVSFKLSPEWLEALNKHIATWPQGKTEDILATVKALHDAGVDILAGSDPSQPSVGGMVHGASLHHELQMLVKAGLTPIEALKSATSIPARRFGLIDRGRIVDGARADLLLVKGDPTTNISDTLSIESVWRQGVKFDM